MRASRWFHILVAASSATAAGLQDVPKPKHHLTWGDVNVLHTTDIHGWILGHPKPLFPEISWSGTFGDLWSFVNHMRAYAEKEKRDLFLVDSGDRRIGHGLTDRLLPGTVNGQLVVQMYQHLEYDVVTPGNHDVDDPAVVDWVSRNLTKEWGDRFITSNIRRNTTGPPLDPKTDKRPFYGVPYRYWTTTQTKKKVLAYGLTTTSSRVAQDAEKNGLLDIVSVKTMITQDWFSKSLQNEVDVFLVVAHMESEKPCSDDGWIYIYDAIRKAHPLTPILMFGGHTHKRACTRFTSAPDHFKRSMLLQSGRYFDTVGWMSTTLDGNQKAHLKMTRRYLDNNVVTYKFHTNKTTDDDFHTVEGITMTDRVYGIDRAEGLSQLYGFLPGDYFLDRKRWDPTDKESMFNFYLDAAENVLINKTRSKNWLFFSNWGIIRGDLYRGEFTLGDLYSVSPNDPSSFLTVKVKRNESELVVSKLQAMFPSKGKCGAAGFAPTTLGNSTQMVRAAESNPCPPSVLASPAESQLRMTLPDTSDALTLGLKTLDVCGDDDENTPYGDGDDVEHNCIPQVSFDEGPPVYFWRKSWTDKSTPPDNAEVDLIFTNYIGKNVPAALNSITGCVDKPANECTPFTRSSLNNYTNTLYQDKLLGTYVRKMLRTIPDDFPVPE
ncbi:hypothetical protein FRC07_003402 [Ceratobasidium sp. 392]|nr:hypothetical protein FRC07_003402 [Ceratobasidium sp. 392]